MHGRRGAVEVMLVGGDIRQLHPRPSTSPPGVRFPCPQVPLGLIPIQKRSRFTRTSEFQATALRSMSFKEKILSHTVIFGRRMHC